RYTSVSVTTNGWVGFGQAAWDYYPDSQSLSDIRNFYRGVFPYWTDLDLQTLPNSWVKKVVRKRDGMIAFQWRTGFHNGTPPVPRRTFQVVLFRDGRIRFDYPGVNSPSDPGEEQETIIAIGGARGNPTFHPYAIDTLKTPNRSILFTPKEVDATRSRRGTVRTTIPDGDGGTPDPFVGASPSCVETEMATATTTGLVRCSVPRIGPGQQKVLRVRWTATEVSRIYNWDTILRVEGKSLTDLERNQT
ncbi:MAG TPA: hypothetical protein VE669_00945, partial [Actinomycetota bacterium]|nr:hypothetical protein [Actinomycetota bacterium]